VRRRPLSVALLSTAIVTAASGCATTTEPPVSPVSDDVRPIVLPESPVSLSSDQEDTVVWPVWGGAFTPDEPVTISGRIDPGGEAASGLVIAGPGEVEDRHAVELLADDGRWTARETDAGEVLQEVDVAGGTDEALAVTVDGAEVSIAVGSTEAVVLELDSALASDDEAAGLYVHLEPGATLDLLELGSSQPLPTHPDLGSPLRALAEERGITIGSALDIWPPLHDIGFESMLGEQFDAATPTEFYWATTRGEDEDWFFVPADLSVNYATVHEQELTGMFLVWDFELPQWVTDVAETGDSDALGEIYDEHVSTLVGRYADSVDAWVVVNEAIWGPDDTGEDEAMFAETAWLDVLGQEHIERAFEVADATDPDAELIYNETGAEQLGPKSDFLYDMVSDFVERGVPIDTVGLQFHIDAANPPDMASVAANMQRFADLGLNVRVTELDVTIDGDSEEQLELQAGLYADVVNACLDSDACVGTTVFGFSDRYSWDELGEALPLMFTEAYEPKPAFFSVQEALDR
jgi:endo-1,4-beta-xylanase